MTVTAKYRRDVFPIEVEGVGRVEVTVGEARGDLMARVGSRSYQSSSLDGVRRQIVRDLEERRAKVARATALKATAENPIPASTYDRDGVLDIGVRGVDQRSGMLLVTMPDGTKDKLRPALALRRLEGADRERLAEALRARAAVETSKATTSWEAERTLPPVEVEVALDPERDAWFAEYEGRRFEGSYPAVLVHDITRHRVERAFPFTVVSDEDGVQVVRSEDARGALFRDQGEALRYAEALHVQQAAQDALYALVEEFRLDVAALMSSEEG